LSPNFRLAISRGQYLANGQTGAISFTIVSGGADLMTVQFGWPVGMPLCRPLVKKTQKTPPEDMAIARKRMKEMKA